MQNSVAATPIANFIFSLYPVLPMASFTKSKPSFKLQVQKLKIPWSRSTDETKWGNLPGYIRSKTTIFSNVTSMWTIFFCNHSLSNRDEKSYKSNGNNQEEISNKIYHICILCLWNINIDKSFWKVRQFLNDRDCDRFCQLYAYQKLLPWGIYTHTYIQHQVYLHI